MSTRCKGRQTDCISSYLIRAEMIALHEGDVSYLKNKIRGAQFYPDCVQIEVTGEGTVELPQGVSFPGAYSYDDPGVVHNVRSTLILTVLLLTNMSVGLLLHRHQESNNINNSLCH